MGDGVFWFNDDPIIDSNLIETARTIFFATSDWTAFRPTIATRERCNLCCDCTPQRRSCLSYIWASSLERASAWAISNLNCRSTMFRFLFAQRESEILIWTHSWLKSSKVNNMATPQQQFINSCTMGEVFKVEKMIQSKEADINKPDTKGFTPLHLAIGAKQVYV